MTEKLARWRREAPRWLAALTDVLARCGKADVVVPYVQVALAFPSVEPNSVSFEYPLIELPRLRDWASRHGWKVRSAPEMAPKDSASHPPVRFTKHDPVTEKYT